MYACALAICFAAGALGQLICMLGGASGWSWLAPGVGLAALLCIAAVGVRLPGHGWTAFALITVAVAGAVLALRRHLSFREASVGPCVVALLVLGLTALPFLFNGRFGLLGAGVDDDLGFHLAWAEALATGRGPVAISGYPLGPHALAAALAKPSGSVLSAFLGLIVAAPVLTALTALAGLSNIGRSRRVVAAVLVGLPYLATAYFAEASFKESVMALLLLTFVLGLQQAGDHPGWRRGLVPGIAGVGTLLVYGADGVVIPVAAGAAWLAVEVAVRRRMARRRLRELLPALASAGFVIAVGALLQIGTLVAEYKGVGSPGREIGAGGNYFREISPLTLTGGWTALDFRLPPHAPASAYAAALVAAAAALGGAWWWAARRRFAVPVAVGACIVVYLWVRHTSLPYYSGKILVIAAPLVMLMSSRAVLGAWPENLRWRGSLRARRGALLRAGAVLAFVTVVAFSTLTQLRYGQVGSMAHANDLIALRSAVARGPTLYLGHDDYQRWELFGVRFSSIVPYGPCRLGTCCDGCGRYKHVPLAVQPGKFAPLRVPFDFDSVVPAVVDRFRYVVTTRVAYASRPPPSWRLLRRGRFYEAWERVGPGRPRVMLPGEGDSPGAILDCRSPLGRALERVRGRAAVRPAPVVGTASDWKHVPGRATSRNRRHVLLSPGSRLTQVLRLPAGRWELDLQYESSVAVTVTAGGQRWRLPPAPEPHGSLWPVGTLTTRGGPVTVSATASAARFGAAPLDTVLGTLAAVRTRGEQRIVPLRQACGRYVDWIEAS